VPNRAQAFVTRALPVMLIAAALGAMTVLGVRLSTWARCWRGSITEGREGPGLYALWRLIHGHALYEQPLGEPYSITLYNFGFYQVYARVSALLGVDADGILLWPRFYTLLGAAFGAALFVRVGMRLARPSNRLEWTGLAALAFVVWFGSQFISWWAFAVRPDVWAAALALLGLDFVLVALESGSFKSLLLAALGFVLAWSFKQSTISTFAGALLAITWLRRDVRRTLALGLPFGAVVGLALVLGGVAYRENLLRAPLIGRMEWGLLREVLLRAIPQNVWVFCFAPAAFLWYCRGRVRAGWARLGEAERLLAVVAMVAVTFGSVACAREGSNKNHLLEGYVAAALCSWCAFRRGSRDSRCVAVGALAMALPLVVMPALQIASALGVVGARFGRTTFCSAADAREFERLAQTVGALPHPLYADDEVLAQPWHATSNRYPALVLDGTWYAIARRERLLPPDFPLGEFARRGLKTAVLPVGHPLIAALRAQGSGCELLTPAPLGLQQVACALAQ
jgi:hypothetical protein